MTPDQGRQQSMPVGGKKHFSDFGDGTFEDLGKKKRKKERRGRMSEAGLIVPYRINMAKGVKYISF